MQIGFVGIIFNKNEQIKMKSCILKNANEKNLMHLIDYNLDVLDKQIDYLIEHDIKIFRISSGAVPFASHEINKIRWWILFKKKFSQIGKKAKKNGIRLSMHPGQYTTLSSPSNEIIKKSIKDLEYHTRYLDALKLPRSNKIILHIGGVYDNKKESINRFIKNYKNLPNKIKRRLVIENDDKCYTVSDLLFISKKTNIPVVFDYLHYLLNHNEKEIDVKEQLELCRETWDQRDGIQKIHYSQQAEGKKLGAHSLTINPDIFNNFVQLLPKEIDVMFEVKDKNLSVLKYYNYKKKED